MRYIKTYKLFESTDTDVDLIRDILLDLSDDGFSIGISRIKMPNTTRNNNVEVIIDRVGQDSRGGMFRGKPFKITEIQNEIDNLISQLSDKYKLASVGTSNMRSEWMIHKSGFSYYIGTKKWTDPWSVVKDNTSFDLKWFKIEFREI